MPQIFMAAWKYSDKIPFQKFVAINICGINENGLQTFRTFRKAILESTGKTHFWTKK